MQVLKVGEPYGGVKRRFTEGSIYSFHSGQHQLVIFMDGIRRPELKAVRQAKDV